MLQVSHELALETCLTLRAEVGQLSSSRLALVICLILHFYSTCLQRSLNVIAWNQIYFQFFGTSLHGATNCFLARQNGSIFGFWIDRVVLMMSLKWLRWPSHRETKGSLEHCVNRYFLLCPHFTNLIRLSNSGINVNQTKISKRSLVRRFAFIVFCPAFDWFINQWTFNYIQRILCSFFYLNWCVQLLCWREIRTRPKLKCRRQIIVWCFDFAFA